MGHAEAPSRLRVSVVYSPRAGEVDECELHVDPGATAGDALAASRLHERHPGLDLAAAAIGIWGVPCERHARLRDRDRLEVYRALQVDPKEARRRRQQGQRLKR